MCACAMMMVRHGGNGSLNERCRELPRGLSRALDLCGADEGINSPNRGETRGRRAPAVCEGETGGEAACAEGAGSCRRLSRRVRTSMVRGGHKHTGVFPGRRRDDGWRCDDSSGGFRRRIGRVVKEERPREGLTSWSFACAKSDGWR